MIGNNFGADGAQHLAPALARLTLLHTLNLLGSVLQPSSSLPFFCFVCQTFFFGCGCGKQLSAALCCSGGLGDDACRRVCVVSVHVLSQQRQAASAYASVRHAGRYD